MRRVITVRMSEFSTSCKEKYGTIDLVPYCNGHECLGCRMNSLYCYMFIER